LALISVHQNVQLTHGQLCEAAEHVARGLAGRGLRPGDRAGICSSNGLEWILLQLGCAMAGLVLVNVNPAYRSVDLGYVLRKSRMRALFLRDRESRPNYREILQEARSGQELPLEHIVLFGYESWDHMLAQGASLGAEPSPHDVANIQYTSGTTGSPKWVLLTHYNLVNNAWSLAEWLKMEPHDRMCVALPLYHCAGCICSSMATLLRGGAVILPSPQFDAEAVLRAMLVALLDHPAFDSFELGSLRVLWTGGSPSPVELMRRVATRTRMRARLSFISRRRHRQ
jgi:fatty-acyl-CoA synthase